MAIVINGDGTITGVSAGGLPDASVVTADIAADAIDGTKLADNAIDSEHYTDASIDEAHIAADAVNFATHLKAGTDGELITWDASGNPAAVAVGTATHVLTSNGAGAAPTFQATGGGSLVYIATVTASSSATVDFLTSFSATYDSYIIKASGVQAASEHQLMYLLVAQSGAVKTDSNYDYICHSTIMGGAAGSSGGAGQAIGRIHNASPGSATSETRSFDLTFHNVNNTAFRHWSWTGADFQSDGTGSFQYGAGTFDLNTTVLTGVQFRFASGNVAAGTFRLYGVVNS